MGWTFFNDCRQGGKCSGNCNQPTYILHINNRRVIVQLQDLLFGAWTPPQDVPSRIHRIGFSTNSHRYKAPPIKIKREKQAPESESRLLKLVKHLNKPMTPFEIAMKTPWTRNHCGMLLCKLWKEGKIKRHKVVKGNTRTFLYSYAGE